MNNNYEGRELKDLNKAELIQIIKDLHKFIRSQDLEMISMRADIERANSLAQRYKTRLETTQQGHQDLVTDAILDRAILGRKAPHTATISWLNPEKLISNDMDDLEAAA